jgi:hypothetical protein
MEMICCWAGTARAPLFIRSQAKGSLRPSAHRLALFAHPLRARTFASSGRFATISPDVARSLMVRLARELRGLFQAPGIDSKRCIFSNQTIFSLFSTPELRKKRGRGSISRCALCSLIHRRPAGVAAHAPTLPPRLARSLARLVACGAKTCGRDAATICSRHPLKPGGFLFPRCAGSAALCVRRAYLRCCAKKRNPLSRPCPQKIAKNARENAFFARLSRSARQVARSFSAARLSRMRGSSTAQPRQLSARAEFHAGLARSSHHKAAFESLRAHSAPSLRSTCSACACSQKTAKNARENAFFARLCSFAARDALRCADAVLSRIRGSNTAQPRQSSDSPACSARKSSGLGSGYASHGLIIRRALLRPLPPPPSTPQPPRPPARKVLRGGAGGSGGFALGAACAFGLGAGGRPAPRATVALAARKPPLPAVGALRLRRGLACFWGCPCGNRPQKHFIVNMTRSL